MKRNLYYQVRREVVQTYGSEVAFLFAVLENIGRVWKKDEQGYFAVWNKYLVEETGWCTRTIMRKRKVLVKSGLISFKPGKNQNSPCWYRINTHYQD